MLVVLRVCLTFGHLSSASRFARACSIGAVHGVALHIVHAANGRPLRLIRINGRSVWGFVRCDSLRIRGKMLGGRWYSMSGILHEGRKTQGFAMSTHHGVCSWSHGGLECKLHKPTFYRL